MTDTDGLSADASVTITVNDVNEAPTEHKALDDAFGNAGESISIDVDLTGVLVDEDAGDRNLLYTVKGPDDLLSDRNKETIVLSLSYEYELEDDGTHKTDADGNYVVTGTITGEAIRQGDLGSYEITVIATDGDGVEGEATFMLHVDDGNDAPLGAELTNLDGSEAKDNTVNAIEDMDGQELGRVMAIDDPDLNANNHHPHSVYDWKISGAGHEHFEVKDGVLKVKDGMMLDREADYVDEDDEITLTIIGTDNKGDSATNDPSYSTPPIIVTVKVANVNEVPVALLEPEEVGDWWVTIDEDLDEGEDDPTDEDYIAKGEWLSFGIETDAERPDVAFMDPDGDKLTYSIEPRDGPEWLEIDEDTGALTNAKEMEADPGAYDVTVTATDPDGESAEISFTIYVAESDAGDEDNHKPSIDVELIDGGDYEEGPNGKAVATVTVTDDDFGLDPHPYGILKGGKPELSDTRNFELSDNYDTSEDGNSRTWTVFVKTGNTLDHETEDDIEVTVRAWNPLGDGNYDDDYGNEEVINIDVEDRNEPPELTSAEPTIGSMLVPGGSGNTAHYKYTVNQQGDNKITLYLNLWELWGDPDDSDDVDELTYMADLGGDRASTDHHRWIKIVHKGRWEDVRDGEDEEEGTTDDVPWHGLTDGSEMDDDTYVVIVEIDRTAASGVNTEGNGFIRMVVSDEDGETGYGNIQVVVDDQNLPIPNVDTAEAVTLTGSMREGGTLTATFEHKMDPDYADGGAPELVVFTWYTGAEVETGTVLQTSVVDGGEVSRLHLTQDHVGETIKVSVQYYELADVMDDESGTAKGGILRAQDGGEAAGKSPVVNSPDRGQAHVVVTTSGTTLNADVVITDEDDGRQAVTYTWQESANGSSGWQNVNGDDTTDADVSLSGGGGKYYRLIVNYTDHGGAQRIVWPGRKYKVALDADPADEPDVTGSENVGGTLVVDPDGGTVQWQQQVDPDGFGGTGDEYWMDIDGDKDGSLELTNHHAGTTLRVVVTQMDDDGAISSITASREVEISGGDSNTAPVNVRDAEFELAIGDDDSGGPTVTNKVFTIRGGLASLFQDAEGDELTFEVRRETSGEDNELMEGVYVYLDEDAGTLRLMTDKDQTHDGEPGDGTGNVIEYTVTATDPDGQTADATISLSINVKPTNSGDDGVSLYGGATIIEGRQNGGDVDVADLNVIDENESFESDAPDYKFGAYDWDKAVVKVNGKSDSRFKVVGDDRDASMATLKIEDGAEFEATKADDSDDELTVEVTVTDMAGEFSHTFEVDITIRDTIAGNNTPDPDPDPDPQDDDGAPGLKDDDDGDTDDDGGVDADGNPGSGGGGGGLGNLGDDPGLHVLENDLLDSFVLAIDDIDAA